MKAHRYPAIGTIIGLACVLAGVRPSAHGAPQTMPAVYHLDTCSLEIAAPVEVGRAKGHFWFSTLHPVQGNDILCGVVLADDKAQGKWPATLCLSRDGGESWRRVRDIDSYGPISTSLGPRSILLMPYECWPASPTDKRNAAADGTVITVAQDGTISTEPRPVRFLNFPCDLANYNKDEVELLTNGNILSLRDGRLFTTVYGKSAGDPKYSNWSVTSDDRGFTWRFQATVARCSDLAHTAEGPDESNTARLADGGLICVQRTGGEYHKCISHDEGTTWSKPEKMDGVFSVEPQLVRLANGVILLSGGRPGLFVWACTDGQGKKWERLSLGKHHNDHVQDATLHYSDAFCEGRGGGPALSTSYTGMAAVGPDEVLVCYDRLGNGWKGAPGPNGQWDVIFCIRIKVTRR
jgi:hypothetical protein